MPAPQVILDLVERFHRQIDAYKSGSYNETQVRREFLDPFFKALGWDVDNTSGYAEAYKDVIHEDSIKIGGFTKAPDYCFRIGGMRKFFLEANGGILRGRGEGINGFEGLILSSLGSGTPLVHFWPLLGAPKPDGISI